MRERGRRLWVTVSQRGERRGPTDRSRPRQSTKVKNTSCKEGAGRNEQNGKHEYTLQCLYLHTVLLEHSSIK